MIAEASQVSVEEMDGEKTQKKIRYDFYDLK